jgi:nucleoside-diphosphate-sugar epimerase
MKERIDLNNKRILVTGSAGFIGSNLVLRLFHEMKEGVIVGFDNLNDYYDPSLKDYRLEVEWTIPEPDEKTKSVLEEILSQNPIPSYQNDPDRVYGLEYDGIEVHFSVGQNKVLVKKMQKK